MKDMTYNQEDVQESTIVSNFLNAAGQGTAKAHFELARVYSSWAGSYHPGLGKDDAKAFIWYRKAAAQGHAQAQCNIGWMYETGRGVEQNVEQAVVWYQKAAEQEDTTAQCNLGLMYESGRGIEKNAEKAVVWYRKAAQQGDARGQYNLGNMYRDGRGIEQKEELAVAWYLKAAEQGYASAQCHLGYQYDIGQGVEENIIEAVFWYEKASAQGDFCAICNLAWCYENGRGVDKNVSEAIRLYSITAEGGYSRGQYSLALVLNAEKKYTDALYWYQKAANQGHIYAKNNLGFMYSNGHGVEKSKELALKWYLDSAKDGNPTAQRNVANMYELGEVDGVIDYKNSFLWYEKAAKNNDVVSQYKIGLFYQAGYGVERNIVESCRWLFEAAKQGNISAVQSLSKDAISKFVSGEELFGIFLKFAESGNSVAQNRIARFYLSGEFVEQDRNRAIYWYSQASKQGDASSTAELGDMYLLGLGVSVDKLIAKNYYEEADRQGYAKYLNRLPIFDLETKAEQGDPASQLALSEIYWEMSEEEAVNRAEHWLSKSCSSNYPKALRLKGIYCWEDGKYIEAIYWLNRSILFGDEEAQGYLEISLEEVENPDELLASAEQYIPDFRPDGLLHTTSNGERVRSKSEVIISTLLLQNKLDYKYEADLTTYGYPKGVRPDFLFGQKGNLIVWEHLGLADDPEYMGRWAKKLIWYRDNGFVSGKNLFVTMETSSTGIDVNSLMNVIGKIKIALNKNSNSNVSKSNQSTSQPAIIFFDFETTGRSVKNGARVIDVGAVKCVDGKVVDVFESLINPGVSIPPEITQLTGIGNSHIVGAPKSEIVMRKFNDFISGAILAAHNASFDESFLISEFERFGLKTNFSVFCTIKLAKRIIPGLDSYSLVNISRSLGLPCNINAHRALPDAKQAVLLYEVCVKKIREKYGVTKLPSKFFLDIQNVSVSSMDSFIRNYDFS